MYKWKYRQTEVENPSEVAMITWWYHRDVLMCIGHQLKNQGDSWNTRAWLLPSWRHQIYNMMQGDSLIHIFACFLWNSNETLQLRGQKLKIHLLLLWDKQSPLPDPLTIHQRCKCDGIISINTALFKLHCYLVMFLLWSEVNKVDHNYTWQGLEKRLQLRHPRNTKCAILVLFFVGKMDTIQTW